MNTCQCGCGQPVLAAKDGTSRRFRRGHNRRGFTESKEMRDRRSEAMIAAWNLKRARGATAIARRDPEKRFFEKVQPAAAHQCWIWIGGKNAAGYGKFWSGEQRLVQSHRWAYEFFRAEIPEGLHLDHLCRVPSCVNPWHLEPVTNRENGLRGLGGSRQRARTHCPSGHEYTPENTKVWRGRRFCRECHRLDSQRRRASRSQARQGEIK